MNNIDELVKWATIDGFPKYEVSNNGRVRSEKGEKKQTVNSHGYLTVGVFNGNARKTVTVHRLVASAFLPNPNGFLQVNHKDENKLNNCVENLEWCDAKYNVNYSNGAQRTGDFRSKPVAMYKDGKLINVWGSVAAASRRAGISGGNIGSVCRGERKTAGGFQFQYAADAIEALQSENISLRAERDALLKAVENPYVQERGD